MGSRSPFGVAPGGSHMPAAAVSTTQSRSSSGLGGSAARETLCSGAGTRVGSQMHVGAASHIQLAQMPSQRAALAPGGGSTNVLNHATGLGQNPARHAAAEAVHHTASAFAVRVRLSGGVLGSNFASISHPVGSNSSVLCSIHARRFDALESMPNTAPSAATAGAFRALHACGACISETVEAGTEARFMGQWGSEMVAADGALHELLMLNDLERDFFVDNRRAQTPGVLLSFEQMLSMWSEHVLSQVVPPDAMALCQLAASQENHYNLLQKPIQA